MGRRSSRPREPNLVAAMPCLCHMPRGIEVSRGQCIAARLLVKQTSLSSRSFFDAEARSHFFAPLDQHDFRAVNLVDAYSAVNFATGISDGGRVNPAARAQWIRFTICLGLFHTRTPKACGLRFAEPSKARIPTSGQAIR